MRNRYEVRGEETVIFINKRNGPPLETIIDTTDLKLVNTYPYSWYSLTKEHGTSYIYSRHYVEQKRVTLHRFILGDIPKDKFVDHIDGDGLNNRRSNLRIVTHQENMQNLSTRRDNGTGRRGVYYEKSRNKYAAYARINGKQKHLGRFDTLEEAANVAKQYRMHHMPFSSRD